MNGWHENPVSTKSGEDSARKRALLSSTLVRKTIVARALILATSCFATACLAADFAAEDPALLPAPKDVATVVHADPSFSEFKSGGCLKLVGSKVDLSGDGRSTDWVVTTADGCAWGAATAPIWVLRRHSTGYSVVLSSGGSDLTVGKGKQNGLKHLAIAAGTAGWYSEVLLKYDGTKYVKARSRQVDLSNPEDCRKNKDVCPK